MDDVIVTYDNGYETRTYPDGSWERVKTNQKRGLMEYENSTGFWQSTYFNKNGSIVSKINSNGINRQWEYENINGVDYTVYYSDENGIEKYFDYDNKGNMIFSERDLWMDDSYNFDNTEVTFYAYNDLNLPIAILYMKERVLEIREYDKYGKLVHNTFLSSKDGYDLDGLEELFPYSNIGDLISELYK